MSCLTLAMARCRCLMWDWNSELRQYKFLALEVLHGGSSSYKLLTLCGNLSSCPHTWIYGGVSGMDSSLETHSKLRHYLKSGTQSRVINIFPSLVPAAQGLGYFPSGEPRSPRTASLRCSASAAQLLQGPDAVLVPSTWPWLRLPWGTQRCPGAISS